MPLSFLHFPSYLPVGTKAFFPIMRYVRIWFISALLEFHLDVVDSLQLLADMEIGFLNLSAEIYAYDARNTGLSDCCFLSTNNPGIQWSVGCCCKVCLISLHFPKQFNANSFHVLRIYSLWSLISLSWWHGVCQVFESSFSRSANNSCCTWTLWTWLPWGKWTAPFLLCPLGLNKFHFRSWSLLHSLGIKQICILLE
jgi:hypothetical protein